MSPHALDASNAPIEHILHYLSSPSMGEDVASLSNDDWDNIAVTAIALGLAPLLHWHLEAKDNSIPPMASAKLGVTRQAHAKRNEAVGYQLAEILDVCAQHGVEVMVLKGALLAPTVYPDRSLRPMNDIDLLFRPGDLPRVGPILESLGYAGKHKDADLGPGIVKHLSTYRREGNDGATPNPYLSAGGDRMIEPHGSLEESWFGLTVDITPGVWERAKAITLHDQPAYRPSTPDQIIHLAVHATFHVIMGAAVFVQLYDIGQVLRAQDDELSWSKVVQLARAAAAERFVYAALFWAKTIFNAPVPEAPLIELRARCSPSLIAQIQSLDGAAIFKRTQQPPLITVPQRLWRGLQDRRETARWADSAAGKWKVWQTALALHKTDTVNLLQKRLKAQP